MRSAWVTRNMPMAKQREPAAAPTAGKCAGDADPHEIEERQSPGDGGIGFVGRRQGIS
jgi:hypothetical protein